MGQINPVVYSVHREDRFCYLKNKQNVNKINRLSIRGSRVSPLKPDLEISMLFYYV